MFYYKYSKLTRWTIALNAVYAVIAIIVNVYKFMQIKASNTLIVEYMKTNNVIRETAIKALQKSGETLYLSDAGVVVGFNLAVVVLILLFFFRKNNSFLLAMLTAMSCTLLNFLGGAYLFYLLFSDKLELRAVGDKHD